MLSMIQLFLKYLKAEKRYSNHTVSAYSKDLLQFQHFLKSQYDLEAINDVKNPQIRDWIMSLSDADISPKSINRKIATLKSFYKFLVAREYLDANPADLIKPLKAEKRLPSFVKEAEINQLLDSLVFEENFSGQRDKLLIELFYNTGIRLAELKNLKETDVNFHEKTIRVLGKRSKERILPVSNPLISLVTNFIQTKKNEGFEQEFLLITDSGKPMYPMFIYRKIKQYLTLVTTQRKKSPHVLRHTFATHLLNNGADLNAVKDLLGHTSLAATQVYTHNSIEKLKETFNQAHPKA